MAPYQPPTVEEIEDEFKKHHHHHNHFLAMQNGIRIQVTALGTFPMSAAAAAGGANNSSSSSSSNNNLSNEAKRLRKRKCPWETAQPRLGKMSAAYMATTTAAGWR